MKSCFNSPFRITQVFGNDFYWDPTKKLSVNDVYLFINSGMFVDKENKRYLLVDEKEVFVELYYAHYGMSGHNGLDVVPTNNDRSLLTNLSGEIAVLGFNETYGNRVGIWNRDLNLFECHNHLEFIAKELKIGKEIKSEGYIGRMGSTGFSTGAHNHFAMAKVDDRCYRINLNNGYKGWIDPTPYLSNV